MEKLFAYTQISALQKAFSSVRTAVEGLERGELVNASFQQVRKLVQQACALDTGCVQAPACLKRVFRGLYCFVDIGLPSGGHLSYGLAVGWSR